MLPVKLYVMNKWQTLLIELHFRKLPFNMRNPITLMCFTGLCREMNCQTWKKQLIMSKCCKQLRITNKYMKNLALILSIALHAVTASLTVPGVLLLDTTEHNETIYLKNHNAMIGGWYPQKPKTNCVRKFKALLYQFGSCALSVSSMP